MNSVNYLRLTLLCHPLLTTYLLEGKTHRHKQTHQCLSIKNGSMESNTFDTILPLKLQVTQPNKLIIGRVSHTIFNKALFHDSSTFKHSDLKSKGTIQLHHIRNLNSSLLRHRNKKNSKYCKNVVHSLEIQVRFKNLPRFRSC